MSRAFSGSFERFLAMEHNLLLRNLSILSVSVKKAKSRAFSAFLTGRGDVLKTE